MYCSSCGVAVAQGLSYCNYCGAKLSGAKGDSAREGPHVRPELLVSAMAGLFILGLLAIIVLMGMMKSVLGLTVESVMVFTLIPFLLMLLLEGVFFRLLMRSKRGADITTDETASLKGHTTRELDAARAGRLPEHLPSVTEHTTRTFDPIHIDRTSK